MWFTFLLFFSCCREFLLRESSRDDKVGNTRQNIPITIEAGTKHVIHSPLTILGIMDFTCTLPVLKLRLTRGCSSSVCPYSALTTTN